MIKLQKKEEKGITLITLVVTIIVLIILAGIAISMTVGDNGIFTKAKEAKRLQITAEAKEKIGTEILDAQVEAVQKNEQLQQSKVEEIISKYGELQADGDTIKLKDNGYEISLKEIYNGTTASSGGSTGGSTGSAELDNLKAELAQTTATEGKVLKDYKAYSNGKLITGTMENYAGKTVTASSITENGDNAEITVPSAGYYGTDSKISVSVDKLKDEIDALNDKLESYTSLESIKKVSGDRSAPITYTATEDMDCIVTIVPVGTGVGGGNYTTTITVDTRTIVSSLGDCFELNNLRSKFVKLKKGETITIINSGNPTTATDYHYMYNSMLYKMK